MAQPKLRGEDLQAFLNIIQKIREIKKEIKNITYTGGYDATTEKELLDHLNHVSEYLLTKLD